ncbi:MAG: hypothetical protein M3Q40_04145 [Pseudomonadota bacterium]|nr:hypothetical protein [Pseudomonadota bacterium]
MAHRAGPGASALQVAEALVATWQEIDLALRPILGQRGVASLYRRTVHLVAPMHPWLGGLREGDGPDMDLAALKALISQQGNADAAAAGDVLLQTFQKLLASLIGPALTGQLLRPVWANPSSGALAQETSQ